MRYWSNTIKSTDRFYLTAVSENVVACFMAESEDGKYTSFEESLIRLGGIWRWDMKSIEWACLEFLGTYLGHIELSAEEYMSIKFPQTTWIWNVNDAVAAIMPLMRAQWVNNQDIPDHVNQFYSALGFNEFYASQHAYFKEHGRMPPLVEGLST